MRGFAIGSTTYPETQRAADARPLRREAMSRVSPRGAPNTRFCDGFYCHKNPITRGLVHVAEDWPWSSYRFYELDHRSMLAMDWDGARPIVW